MPASRSGRRALICRLQRLEGDERGPRCRLDAVIFATALSACRRGDRRFVWRFNPSAAPWCHKVQSQRGALYRPDVPAASPPRRRQLERLTRQGGTGNRSEGVSRPPRRRPVPRGDGAPPSGPRRPGPLGGAHGDAAAAASDLGAVVPAVGLVELVFDGNEHGAPDWHHFAAFRCAEPRVGQTVRRSRSEPSRTRK